MKTRSNYKKGGKKTRKTRKSYSVSATKYTQQHIVTMFLQMLNTVKLYHWKTSSYAQHKATDDLYANLNTNIDSFVEVMLGKTGGRVNLTGQKTLPLLDYNEVVVICFDHTQIDATSLQEIVTNLNKRLMENNYIIHASGKVRIDRIDHLGIYNAETNRHTHKLRVIKKII